MSRLRLLVVSKYLFEPSALFRTLIIFIRLNVKAKPSMKFKLIFKNLNKLSNDFSLPTSKLIRNINVLRNTQHK